jgi:Zn finger protein HypA/HybF involved in hydrogenase expression
MATQAEKKLLIETLKFTPRTYKISMWGYGGEKVMGTVEREVWDYCMDNQVDLSDIAWGDEDTVEEMDLDIDMLPFHPGQWYECDSMAHTNGVSRNAGTVQIEDENGEIVFEKRLEDCDSGSEDSPCWSCQDEAWIGSKPAGTVVFIGSSNEKGTFFEGEIELTAPFDIEKLVLGYDEIDGEELVNSVEYDGDEIDNFGGSTDGKSSDFGMYLVKDSNSWETYSPEEKDWGHPEYGTSPSSWEKSETFKFKKIKPTIPGYYSCTWKHFGTTYGSAYWDGEQFGEWEYGQFKPITGEVVTWSGYNWDTSDWANQPPEPADQICDNKNCGWIGMADACRVDEETYDRHCPECDGKEFTYIDYDPDTKEGQANRAKYCRTANDVADLEAALEELKAEFEALCADDADELKLINCACKGCAWEGPIDDTLNNEHDEMVCPECKSRVDIISEEDEAAADSTKWPF